LGKVEKAFIRLQKDNYSELVDVVSAKMEGDLGMYMPKVQTMIFDFEDFRADIKKQMAALTKQLGELGGKSPQAQGAL
jgi:hypothetical protein